MIIDSNTIATVLVNAAQSVHLGHVAPIDAIEQAWHEHSDPATADPAEIGAIKLILNASINLSLEMVAAIGGL